MVDIDRDLVKVFDLLDDMSANGGDVAGFTLLQRVRRGEGCFPTGSGWCRLPERGRRSMLNLLWFLVSNW